LFSGFVTIGRYGKWLTDLNLLLTLIRQMAALVKTCLGGDMLLVFFVSGSVGHIKLAMSPYQHTLSTTYRIVSYRMVTYDFVDAVP